MKRVLWILAILVLTFTAAQAHVPVGWTCTTSSSCDTQHVCPTPECPRHPRVVTETCCPPPCNPPCEILPCHDHTVGVFCDC